MKEEKAIQALQQEAQINEDIEKATSHREITQEEFLAMVDQLAERRPLLKQLLQHYGSYDKLGRNIHVLIDKELGVVHNTKTIITLLSEEQKDERSVARNDAQS